jgi:hypothetical protein
MGSECAQTWFVEYRIHRSAPTPAIRIYLCRSQNQITLLEDWQWILDG